MIRPPKTSMLLRISRKLFLPLFTFVLGANCSAQEVIVDNTANPGVAITGSWTTSNSTAAPGFYGANYLHDGNAGKGSKSVRFTPNLPGGGIYEVYLRWTAYSNRASNVPIDIVHANGTDYVQVDQRANGGQWILLGNYSFDAGTGGSVLVSNTGTNGYVVADAVRFVWLNAGTGFPSAVAPDSFGVCTGTTTDTLVDADYQKMQEAGVRYIRADLSWVAVEKQLGVYDWSKFDTITAKAAQYGLKINWILCYTNTNTWNGTPLYPGETEIHRIQTEAARQGFARYAAAAVARYDAPGVIWEVWNEPNGDFWVGSSPDEYMALVNIAVPAIRSARPSCKVVSGGALILDWPQTISWFNRCFQLGLLTKVDGLGVHIYGDVNQSKYPERVSGEIANLRRMITSYGGPADFPILNTEYGVRPAEYTGTAAEQELQKAQNLVRGHLECLLNKLCLNIWYEWRRPGANSSFAWVNPDLTPRTSYTAASTMTAQLAGYTLERRVALGSNHDVYALLFRNGSNRKLVVWASRFSQNITLPVTTTATFFPLVDLLGAASTVPVSSSSITLNASCSAMYVNVATAVVSDSPALDGRFETEYLSAATGSDPISFFSDMNASNGSGGKLESNGIGDYISYSVPVAVAGTYNVKVRFKSNTTRGIFQLAIDGANQGLEQTQHATSQGWVLVELGSRALTAGTHQFRFNVTGRTTGSQGYDLTFDYIELSPLTGTQLYEAECLSRTQTDPVQKFAEMEASNTNAEKLTSNAAGDSVSYSVPLPTAGAYRIKIRYKKAPTRGIFQLAIDDGAGFVNQGGTQDQHAGVNTWFEVDLGTRSFSSAGNKIFRFMVTGKNGISTGYELTVDSIRLEQ